VKRFFNKSGFTLIEILVAMTLSSVIMLMIYSAHKSIMFSIKDMAGVADFYESVNLAMRRIDRDISCTMMSPDNKKLYFVGANDVMDRSNGKVSFVTVLKSDYYLLGSVAKSVNSCDVKEVSYYLKNDPKIDDLYYLVRKEDIQYDDKPGEGGVESIMLMNVTDIRFEFTDQKSWEKQWDSKNTNKFPQAVKTILKVKNFKGKEEIFEFLTILKGHTSK